MNIVITGASNGIGFETAAALCRTGSHNIIALSRNKEKLDILSWEVRNYSTGSQVIPLVFDLRDTDYSPVVNAAGNLGEIHSLVNNAGYLVNKLFMDLSDNDWEEVFRVNLLGSVRMARALAQFMGKSSKGHIINISSMGGYQGSAKFPGLSAYSSIKGALNVLTECLAIEFADRNISVNCLALGAVDTEMLAKAFPNYKAPLTSTEIAAFITDFALTGSRYFNGKILPVSISTP